ncbi:substrate-binding domain-containing protein [Sphingobacterium faecale]|uniref:Substrate-binding domain-containing protein n=1 Tax=Sphingobacterium faecale TaxID=2803775 RepID=A0ABS1R6A0_9SPHI|nr:substrate-binding domain-containing protein [Sphingobacterium faecale]MBL1410178.1 substrate-binding domain-containing protein [Sphingobacterium faecale]
MRFKKIASCLLTSIISVHVLLFTGCLPREAKLQSKAEESTSLTDQYQSKKDLSLVKVGYCGPSMVAPYYVALETIIKKQVQAYGMQYFTADGQEDVAKQVAAIEDLLSKGIQVLILNPLDSKAVVPVVKRAHEAGVMIFIVDSMIDESAPYIASIVADNTLNGELLGLWLADQRKEELKIAVISGNQGNPVGREKRLGFVRGLVDGQLHHTAKTNFSIVAQGWGKWNNNGGVKAMEDILVAHPYVNVLLAENDAMAMGALKAIKEMGKDKQITVLGYDGQKEAYEMIKEGTFAATAQNSPRILGEMVVETTVKYLNGEKNIEKLIYTPSVLISKKNVDAFYDPKALF